MSINRIGISDHSTSWRKRKTQQHSNIPGIDFASRMADMNTARINSQASNRVNGEKAITEAAFGRDNYVNGTSDICATGVYSKDSISATQDVNLPVETERYKNEDASYIEGVTAYSITDKDTEPLNRRDQRDLLSNEANAASSAPEANTRSEIIVKPDGSRVLMITVEIGGMQTAMSLQISEPTDMQNDISEQKDSRSETPVNAVALTSDVILGSIGEE